MGDRSHFHSSTGLRLLARLVSLLAALLVLSLSGRAMAAGPTTVPMCGERNESVAAPPIFWAHDSGSLSAGPCHPDKLQLGHQLPPAPERSVLPSRTERALHVATLGITRSAGTRLAIAASAEVDALPGHAGLLFRPPRA